MLAMVTKIERQERVKVISKTNSHVELHKVTRYYFLGIRFYKKSEILKSNI